MGVFQDDPVLYTVTDAIAVLTLNRPDRGNGWTGELGRRYFSLLEQAARDEAVRAIIVTGAGKAFCVGGDGAKLSEAASSSDLGQGGGHPYWFPLQVGKPVIAAINGACFGIGLQQILCCDLRIASEDAKFSTAYARRGLVAEYGMSWMLPRIIGTGNAMDMLLSARLIRAGEADKMGLVNRVVPAAELMDAALAYARDLAQLCAPSSLAALKAQVMNDLTATFAQSYAGSEALLADAVQGDDFKEGVKSWQEQRPPVFSPLPSDKGLLTLT